MPTWDCRQSSEQLLDDDDEDDINEGTLDMAIAKANVTPNVDTPARFIAEQAKHSATNAKAGSDDRETAGSSLAAEHVPAETTDANATESVATPAHITKKNEYGKHSRNNCDLGCTPHGIVELCQPPMVKPPRPGSLGSFVEIAPGEQKKRAIINADKVNVVQYAMAELGDYIAQLISPIIARQHAAERGLDLVSEELRATHQNVVALEAKLEHQSIQQDRVAASIAHQQC
jgi:hypothetical protein